MQPEKPESQVKLQLFLPAFALLFASRLNVPLLPRGIPRRRHRRPSRRRWADEELMASALACANHFPVGISLWGIVTWEFRVLPCLLPVLIRTPNWQKIAWKLPSSGYSQSVLQLSLMKHNICAAWRCQSKWEQKVRPALPCSANPSSCSSRTPLISTAGSGKEARSSSSAANYPKHKSIVLGRSTFACEMPFALLWAQNKK